MKIRFLGTAAFEGIPSLFCRCELCAKARAAGGKEIRSRTSVMLDDDLKIDFPPDTFMHMVRDGLDLERIKDLIFTHSHSDHLYAEDMAARLPGYAQSAAHPIDVYANDAVLLRIKQTLDFNGGLQGKFTLNQVKPFEQKELQTAVIVPLPASHDPIETCLLYYIEKDGKSILYGHDSGWFPDETWAWLQDKTLDLAVLECTVGRSNYRKTHMNIDAVLETNQRFEEYGILKPGANIVVTHFSHNAQLSHAELTEIFEPHGIQVAYDGMILELL
ncbi:MBL fold metallo-hydrolase [Paenibacillus sp. KQZ6P-2]|uniref:MBL fold metallo-hydrolase n=1 Tax=Paenibacillus mangrovi TaxID=2931978 RepID=A0A9X1WU53_9BACL|nr:MBL fold metallo-hydrolase [Paenibacillus mangrovi]MCJ8014646.1 MBL fold metallo-hydrolase [Paenibacillus mangrovi]